MLTASLTELRSSSSIDRLFLLTQPSGSLSGSCITVTSHIIGGFHAHVFLHYGHIMQYFLEWGNYLVWCLHRQKHHYARSHNTEVRNSLQVISLMSCMFLTETKQSPASQNDEVWNPKSCSVWKAEPRLRWLQSIRLRDSALKDTISAILQLVKQRIKITVIKADLGWATVWAGRSRGAHSGVKGEQQSKSDLMCNNMILARLISLIGRDKSFDQVDPVTSIEVIKLCCNKGNKTAREAMWPDIPGFQCKSNKTDCALN